MKKFLIAAFLVLTASSAFASERPCRAWGYHHNHHRYCRHY